MTESEKWMGLALEEALKASANGEVPVGAVVVKDNHLIAAAHNGPIGHSDPTAHAEILALRAAATQLNNYRLVGCQLYVTLEPCMMCLGAMVHARIEKLFFSASDPKTGVCGGVASHHLQPFLNHTIQVTGGILQAESSQLLKTFFRERR